MIHRIITMLALTILALPATAAAQWTGVRDLVTQADKLTDKAQREKLLRKAYAQAQKSVRASPTVSNEYLWLANAAGRLAQTVALKERITLAKVVKENAEKAVSLDARNGAAHMTLGAWHFYVADISWVERNAAKAVYGELPSASYQTAVNHLTLALKHGAENPVEIYWIRGRAHDALDKEKLAAADFRACIAGKARNELEKRMQKRAKEELE